MPASTTPSLLSPAQLEGATDLIERTVDLAGWDQPGTSFGILDYDGQHVTTAVRSLEGIHPADALLGFVAPPEWLAFGIVTEARARAMSEAEVRQAFEDDQHDRADRAGRPDAADELDALGDPGLPIPGVPCPELTMGRVRTAVVVGRDGRMSSVLRCKDGARVVSPASFCRPGGRIDDYLRRALELPTRPERAGSDALWVALWLDRLRDVLGEGTTDLAGHHDLPWLDPGTSAERRRWLGVMRCHPAFEAILLDDPRTLFRDGTLPSLDVLTTLLVRSARTLTEVMGWENIRRRTAADGFGFLGIHPDDAAWFDVPSFAREVLALVPAVDVQLTGLRPLLPPAVHRRIRRVLLSLDQR